MLVVMAGTVKRADSEQGSLRRTVWPDLRDLSPEQQVDRLAGDIEVVEALKAARWAGDDWDFFADVLATYGLGVITGWLMTGKLNQKCREKKVSFTPVPEWVAGVSNECQIIAAEVVARAIHQFQTKILPRGMWNPSRGASLATYFIGQCLFQVGPAVRAWEAERDGALPSSHEDLEMLAPEQGDTAHQDALRQMAAVQLLDKVLEGDSRRALEMEWLGYSREEIAEELGIDKQAVAMRISRGRRKLRQAVHQYQDGGLPA